MAKRKRGTLILSQEERKELEQISRQRMAAATKVRRARILLLYTDGNRISEIVRTFRTNRPLVERTIDKALTFGPSQAIDDLPRPGRPPHITDEAKAWVLSVACRKPTDFGYAHEVWTYSLLAKHLRKHCQKARHSCLAKLGNSRLHAILSKSNIKPHKIGYYLERRGHEFDRKMANVLCVYKEVKIQKAHPRKRKSTTISYDEKPGIQAI